MDINLLAPKFVVLYIFFASALFIHFRGKVRHRFSRQITDHSTIMAPYNALMYFFSAVPNKPYIDVSHFPELSPLRANWQMIREEVLKLADESQIRAATAYNDVGFNSFYRKGWKRFYLKWYGEPFPSAKALCPKTVALIESIPSINAAMFASLPPGGKLVSHRDPFAGSLRYHLGLVTPNSEACYILVDGEPYYWRDGEDVMFDETYIHFAENKTDMTRLILFCDIERPLRSRIMMRFNRVAKSILMRAAQTQNVKGERIGMLNRIFGYIYPIRLAAKRLKSKNRTAYFTLKWTLFGGLLYAIFI